MYCRYHHLALGRNSHDLINISKYVLNVDQAQPYLPPMPYHMWLWCSQIRLIFIKNKQMYVSFKISLGYYCLIERHDCMVISFAVLELHGNIHYLITLGIQNFLLICSKHVWWRKRLRLQVPECRFCNHWGLQWPRAPVPRDYEQLSWQWWFQWHWRSLPA